MSVSRIGLGTWSIGGGPAWAREADVEGSVAAIRKCPSIGVNLIDTAPAYNFGSSERIVGQALAGMNRSDVVLATKCGITWTREGSLFNKVGDTQLYKNLSPESIRDDIRMSLERLGTDYIDIYLTHWQSVEPCFTPIAETMAALDELKREGRIKAIGACNVTPEQIEEYLKHGQLDVVQCKYSILDRKVEQEILPLCRQHGIMLQAYSPLEQGLLSGKIGRDYVPPKGSAKNGKRWYEHDNMIKAVGMIESWRGLCENYHCTVPDLAIAWLLAQGDNFNVLSGASSIGQLEENVKATDVRLSAGDAMLMRGRAEALD